MIWVGDMILRVGRAAVLDDVWGARSCRMSESGCRCWRSSLACSLAPSWEVEGSGVCSL